MPSPDHVQPPARAAARDDPEGSPVTIRSARNDRLADPYLAAVLHRDPEAMLLMLVEVARAGGTRNLIDFFDAVGAAARDLLEQLGADQAEDHLRRRLLAAVIRETNQHPEWGKTVAIVTTKALAERRDKLNDQLTGLQSQHVDIVQDLRIVEQDWQAALQAGEDTALLGERRRHREAELAENERSTAQVAEWTAEVEAELRRRVPHEQLDRDLAAHAADLVAYAEVTDALAGSHPKAVDALEAAVLDLYGTIATARQRSDQLAARTQQLRAAAVQLGRTDQVAGPPDWVQPVEHALRGGPLWQLYLASVQARQPTALVRALADAVTTRMTEQLKAARSR
jgi:hypothetical protein